jgi:hypothetical protein
VYELCTDRSGRASTHGGPHIALPFFSFWYFAAFRPSGLIAGKSNEHTYLHLGLTLLDTSSYDFNIAMKQIVMYYVPLVKSDRPYKN